MKKGLAFEKEVITSLRYFLPEAYIYKFPNLKNSVAVPGDILLLHHGTLHCIECKSTQNAIAFDINLIRPKQVELAKRVYDSGGKYWLFISNRCCNRNITTFILDSFNALKLTDESKKTIKWDEINLRSKYVFSKKSGIIQLQPWIESYVNFDKMMVL
jgi:penicillin-binding protein-related factor A (putative recombinase)